MTSTMPALSFEFFPPKTAQSAAELDAIATRLASFPPSFMTVTYGAGGSTHTGTLETVTRLARETRVPMAAHLTFCGTPREQLHEYADILWNSGIHHLVTLRGDLPPGRSIGEFSGPAYYQYTSDFVSSLLERHPYEISVGAYPEKHPDAPDMPADIEALRKKCAAGATRAITQFFFDNKIYYRFLDLTAKAGITTPIVPGLMAISDFAKLSRFAQSCQATIPSSLHDLLAEAPPEDARMRAADFLAAQIDDLAAHGVQHIHVYTLNRLDPCFSALDLLKKYGKK